MRSRPSVRSFALLSLLSGGALFATLAACSGEDESVVPVGTSPGVDGGGSSSGSGAARIAADTGVEWVIEIDPRTNTASLAYPKVPTGRVLAAGQDAAAAASAFLLKYPEVFGVAQASDLAIEAAEVDPEGATHVRLVQAVHGKPVTDAVLQVHFDADGGIDHVSGPFYPTLAAAAARTPTVTAATASQTAVGIVQARVEAGATVTASAVVTEVRVVDHVPLLVHVVRVTANRLGWQVWIDVATGQQVRAFAQTQTLQASGTGVGGNRSFTIDEPVDGRYRLSRTGEGNRPTLQVFDQSVTGSLYSSASVDQWEAAGVDPTAKGLAVETFYKMGLVDNWFRGLGWPSFDGKGSPIRVEAFTADSAPRNAFYSGNREDAYFAVTVGTLADDGTTVLPPFTDTDSMGHEFTHAVFHFTTQIDSDCASETGAFNEGIADIFGELVSDDTMSSDPGLSSEEYGEAAICRSLKDPAYRNTPRTLSTSIGTDHVENKTGECHEDGGIVGLAWYLMTFGGDHPEPTRGSAGAGLGMAASKNLWWTLLRYELRGASSFKDVAKRTLLVSRYKKMPREAIGCSWKAVGVLSAEELKANYAIECAGASDGGTDSGVVDSCAGRSDGTYCSSVDPRAAFLCQGGSSQGANFCAADEHCTGPNGAGSLQCTKN